MPSSGDTLLFVNNLVLTMFLVPTVMKRKANVHWLTAAVYVPMIIMAAIGYALNGQWWPMVPTIIGALLWFVLLLKSWRRRHAP